MRCTKGGCRYGYDKESCGDVFVHECLGELRRVV
jgi:hypothetical protein